MPCPHCAAATTAERATRTALGYRTYRCHACRRSFNERSGAAPAVPRAVGDPAGRGPGRVTAA